MSVEEIGFVHVRLPLRAVLATLAVAEIAPEAGGKAVIAGFSRSCSLPGASPRQAPLSSHAPAGAEMPNPAGETIRSATGERMPSGSVNGPLSGDPEAHLSTSVPAT